MLTYDYEAKDPATGKHIKASVQAESEKAAGKLLIAQGFTPLSIVEQGKKTNPLSALTNRVGTKDKIIFSRQLSTLVNAGLPLAQSLRTVSDQTENKKLKSVINDVITSIEGGSTLAGAFAKHPDIFSDVYIALVTAGETSGTLDEALERIANQQEKDAELMGKVKGALVYPIIVLVVILGVVGFLLFTVVPQIEKLYEDLGAELPFLTQAMVGASNFLTKFWYVVLIAIGIGVYFLKQYLKTDGGRKVADTFKVNMPIFGVMFKKLYMARLTRTGQTLMATGVPMLETLRISAQAVNNSLISDAILRASEKVKGGKALSESLKKEEYILSLVPQMISIGEQSGGIDAMMGKAATFYETDLDNTIRSISTAIEPILMVVLAVVAGGMVGAILMPIYSLIGSGAVAR